MNWARSFFIQLRSNTASILAVWTLTMICLIAANLQWTQHHILETARTEARTSIEKDLLYRNWNSSHGGVYVPVTEDTVPNPYLQVAERDITAPSGKLLTLMNPAYMNRQVFEQLDGSDIYAHLTSLNPLNPGNQADDWERQALLMFENGATEASSVDMVDGDQKLRLMVPFITTESCLNCHASQGYKVGDVRGGLSVSIPLSRYITLEQSSVRSILWGYGITWLVGLAGIVLAVKRWRQQQDERESILRSLEQSHKKLEVSEEKFSKVFRFSPAPMLLSSLEDGVILDVNDKFLESFGFASEQVIGHCSVDLGIIDAWDRKQLLRELLLVGYLRDVELVFHTMDGAPRICQYSAEMIELEGQQCLLSLIQDITAHKQAEEQLRESEASLRFSQQVAHVGNWTWDTQTNKVAWSDEMKRVFGLDPRSFDGDLSQVIANAIHPDDREKVNTSNETVLTEQKPAPIEYRVIWPDQSVHTIWAVPGGKETDEDGKILKLSGIVQDITERKAVEEALREHEKLLLQAQQVANLGYYLLDVQSGVWKSSTILDRIFGIEHDYKKDVQGWAAIVHPVEREEMAAYFANEVLGQKKNFDREYRIMRINDQAVRWVHGLGELQFNEQGNPIRMVGTIQDTTERKQAEELLRLSESRYRALFDQMMDGFALHEMICDDSGRPVDYRFLAINPAFEKSTGLQAENILGRTVLEVMPNTEPVWIERYCRVALTGEPDHFESFAAELNTYYEVRAFSPLPGQFAVVFHDISQRKYSENFTLARMKIVEIATTDSFDTLLQVILDEAEQLTSSCIGFYHFLETDQKTLSLQNWSTRTLREFCHAEGKGMHYPVDKAGVWVDCIRVKKPVIHNDYKSLTHHKGLPEGHAEIIREMVVPVMRGDRIIAILGVGNKHTDYTQHDVDIVQQLADLAIEIVERKRAEDSQIQVQRNYENLIQTIDGIVWEADAQSLQFLFVSDQAERLLGYPVKQWLDTPHFWADHIHPADRESTIDICFTQAQSKQAYELEYRMIAQDGRIVWLRDLVSVLSENSSPSKLRGIMIDITERKHAEEEVLEKSADLAALFSLSAHLRTASSANEMLPVVLQEMHSVLNSDANAVILVDHRGETLTFALTDHALSSNIGKTFAIENSISTFVMQTRQPYITSDFARDATRTRAMKDYERLGPAVLVPLQSETEFIGCLLCARHKDSVKGEFSNAEIQLLKSIGEMVGTALRRVGLYEDALLRLRRVQGLRAIDVAMTTTMDLGITLNILLSQALTLMGVDAADILTFSAATRTLNYAAGMGFHTQAMQRAQLRLGEGIAGQSALERRTIEVSDISAEKELVRQEILRREGFYCMFVAPMITKGQMRGVLELYTRKPSRPNEEWMDFLEALATQAAIAIDNAQLYKDLQRSNLELSLAYDATIEGWSHALDLKDKETEGHTLRVTDWSIKLAALAGMHEAEIVHLRRGALLHDIGKLGIPDHILGKPDKLTDDEREIMRQHPVFGYNMIRPIEFLRPAADIPYCHHERWDGTGYPQGLSGDQIPYSARLFAIVDVWDAITSDRPYRKAWTPDQALDYIRSERGRKFDPEIVDLFLKLVDDLRRPD